MAKLRERHKRTVPFGRVNKLWLTEREVPWSNHESHSQGLWHHHSCAWKGDWWNWHLKNQEQESEISNTKYLTIRMHYKAPCYKKTYQLHFTYDLFEVKSWRLYINVDGFVSHLFWCHPFLELLDGKLARGRQ